MSGEQRPLMAGTSASLRRTSSSLVDQESSFFDDFITNYWTHKRVIVKSKLLKVPELILVGLALLYILVYKLGYQMMILETGGADSAVLIDLMSPCRGDGRDQLSRARCSEWLRPEVQPPYCTADHSPGCGLFDEDEVMPSELDQGRFMATWVRDHQQRRCDQSATSEPCAHVWEDTGEGSEKFVQGIENLTLRVRHSFRSNTFIQEYDATATASFIEHWNGTSLKLACHDNQNCSQFEPVGELVQPCVEHTLAIGCLDTDFGDMFSVGLMLDAANVDLDERTADGVSKRREGMMLRMEITYSNVNPISFWAFPSGGFWHRDPWWWWSPELRARINYRFTQAKLGTDNTVGTTSVHWINASGGNRRIVEKHGIYLLVVIQGTLGRLSYMQTVTALIVSSALVSACSMFVNYVLVFVYSLFQRTRATSLMFELYAYQMTPQHDKVAERMDSEERMIALAEHERRVRLRRLLRENAENADSESGSDGEVFDD